MIKSHIRRRIIFVAVVIAAISSTILYIGWYSNLLIVKNIETGEEREMVRKELANSYSPESLVMHHDDEPETLWTAHYIWRLP